MPPSLEDEGDQESARRYGPPKKPLTPNQLGRIAQSFGIAIPDLPHPLPFASTSTSNRYHRSSTPTRNSPYLLTVIPPWTLLHSNPGDEKRRRWKSGRLLPLQPTIGSMLLCIAREYGLPSTSGLSLYLVVTPSSHSSSASTSTLSSDECSGPLISPSTWSTLFSSHISAATASRAASPVHTPRAQQEKDVAFPPSPLSLVEKHAKRNRLYSLASAVIEPTTAADGQLPGPIPSPAALPPTPRSTSTTTTLASSVVGTVEFDIDLDVATWFDEWRRNGRIHRRAASSSSDSDVAAHRGKRQLRLVRKMKDDKSRTPSFGQSSEVDSSESHVVSIPTGDTTLVTDVAEDELTRGKYELRYAHTAERTLTVHDHPGMISVSPSFDQFTESDLAGHEFEPDLLAVSQTEGPARGLEDLLASPIELEKVQLERVRMANEPKRGSGVVMAEELDDLERSE